MNLEEIFPITLKYQPFRDEDGRVVEEESHYVHRMLDGVLSNWPENLLKEWLYRHPDCMEDYAFLNLERLKFTLETWPLERVPGSEAFKDDSFCDNFDNIEERAEDKYDWLARYMLKEGTWNTPIVLLENQERYNLSTEVQLKQPYHLLEGHRRLSFLNGLRRLNKARPQHQVWLAKIHT